jgi:hypothetical protein
MSRRSIPLIIGSLLILGLVAFVFIHRSSPGDLAKAHAAVAGSPLIMDCKKCHAAAGLTSGCLRCHTEIQDQLKAHKGYHDYLAKAGKTECAKCHSEHNGAEFALVNKASWEGKDLKTFTHPQVIYRLTGAHATLACEKCHTTKNHVPYSLPKFKKYPRNDTYLGLQQVCMSCHADPHAGGKAWNCTGCHNQRHWKPAPLFNHDKFYPLRGAHAIISCSKCHVPSHLARKSPATKWAVAFGPTKGKRCIDCHTSPHHVKWVEGCEACHKGFDKTWRDADWRMTKLEHAETGYRLIPPHAKVKCLDCHGPDMPGVPFNVRYPNPRSPGYDRRERDCEGCHKDEHRGQFVSKYPKCILCHTLRGWKPNNFGVQMHNKTSYPLIGGHATAECNKCHIKEPGEKQRRYVHTPRECSVCHKDIHFGQFRKENGKTRCESCHISTVKWATLIFDHETQSRFKLGEAHKKVACKECHPMVSSINGVQLVQYKPIKSKCSDCHGLDELENR